MGSWTIYNKNGVAKAVVKELELHDEWMAECFLTLTINSATPIQFAVGDYIDYRNERYTIEYDPNVIKRATIGTYGDGFVYDGIKFVGSQDEIVRCDFNDIVLSDNNVHYTALPTFPFYCESVDDLLDRIQANLEDLYPNQWIVIGLNTVRNSQRGSAVGRQTAFENAYKKWIDPDMTPHTDPYGKQSVAESADNITCWDALAKVHEDFGLNFIVRGKVVIVGTAGAFTANIFRYGKGNGLTEIEKVGDSSQQIVTRLRAYGSETNLPSHYYSALNMRPYGNVSSLADNNRVILDVLFEDRYFTTDSQSGGKSVTVLVGESTASTSAYKGTNNNIVLHLEGIQVAVGDKIYFTDGVKRDMWPNDHKDYSQDALPENMAVSRLMLPMFPNTSLYDWVKAHRDTGTEYDDTTGLATYHGFTAYFSKEPHRPYIDSLNKAQYGVRPASIYFDGSNETDDIHPTIEGMSYDNVRIDAVYSADQISDSGVYDDSSVTVPNFHITLPDLGFNLAEVYEENASIDMKDGMCGGRSFKFASKPTQDSNGRWVCEVQRDKDENLNLFFPYCDFQITSGDHYVLTGIQMPDAYIEAAAVKLLDAALDALQKNEAPRFTYQPKIDKNFMQRQHDTASASQSGVSLHDTLKAGDVFVFADADMGIDASIIIDVLTIKENGDNGIPTYEITLRDDKQVSTIQKIQNKIDSVINGAININSGVSGLTAQQVRSLINNYGGSQFLSKLNNDTAAGYIKMLKGLQIGNNFASGILGEGGVLRKRAEDGKVELEVDILYARMKAYFDTVEVREYQHTGGNRIASVAGNRICRVEWYDANNQVLEQTSANLSSVAYFRCYFRATDGEDTVRNNWVVGDMAYCHVTSIANSSDNPEQKGANQKHLWRLVIGRNTEGTLTADGEGYIDLSNRSTETISSESYAGYQNGSDAPSAQDDIIQLGNVNDTTRQGAIVEFVTGTDAPSYQIFQGISSFSLNNKNQITIGYNTATGKAKMDVFGDAYIGARDRSTYIEYNQGDGTAQNPPQLNIKAKVQTLPDSTYEGKSASQFVQDNQIKYDQAIQNLTNITNDLQSQIDGEIVSWFYEGTPTLNNVPAVDWNTDVLKERHLGDMYYDVGTGLTSGFAYRFVKSEQGVYSWQYIDDTAITLALAKAAEALGLAATKAKTFTTASNTLPSPPYKTGDLWLNATGTWGSGDAAVTWNGDILKVKANINRASGDTPLISDWELAGNYMNEQDFLDWKAGQYAQDLTNASNAYQNDAVANAIKKALGSALGATTLTDGGLMLTSLIYLRKLNKGGDPTQVSDYTTWAGISGVYDAQARGKGIAAWYGGAKADMEDMTDAQQTAWDALTPEQKAVSSDWAKSLDRFDGSGYRASKNIRWTADGKVYIANIHTASGAAIDDYFFEAFAIGIEGTTRYINPAFSFSDIDIVRRSDAAYTITGTSVLNRDENDARYMVTDRFKELFRVYNGNSDITDSFFTNGLPPDTSNVSIKAMFDFWSQGGITALGQGSQGGGGGQGDVTWALLADNTDTRQVALSHLTTALTTLTSYTTSGKNYAVQKDSSNHLYVNVPCAWGDISNKPTTISDYGITDAYTKAQVDSLTRLKSVALASDGVLAFELQDGSMSYVDLTHQHGFQEILDRPTTIAGYGITDAKIANGVITIGDNTITPLTSHQSVVDNNPTLAWSTKSKVATIGSTPIYVTMLAKPTYTLDDVSDGSTRKLSNYLPLTGGTLSGLLTANSGIYVPSTSYIKIGDAYLTYDSNNNAIRVSKNADGTGAANFYALGGVSALGASESGGGGGGQGDVTWELLKSSDTRQINISHLAGDANYAGVMSILTGYTTSGKNYKVQEDSNHHLYVNVPWTDNNTTYINGTGLSLSGTTFSINSTYQTYISNGNTAYGWGNHANAGYALQTSLNALEYFNSITRGSDGTITFTTNKSNSTTLDLSHQHSFQELTDKPTTIAGYGITDVYSWARQSTKPSYAFSEITGTATANQIPSIQNINSFGTYVYSAQISRTANTVLAAPNGSAGVASFRSLVAADIPSLDWSKIGSGKPTTLSEYGITDACTQSTANGLLYTMSLNNDGTINVSTLGGTAKYSIDFTHQHSFFELVDRPTTIDGYSITGGKFVDDITFVNTKGINMLNTANVSKEVMYLSAANVLVIGSGTSESSYSTYLRGYSVYLKFGTTGATGLILNSSGNVGIGTSSPSCKLHVDGDIYATGGVTALVATSSDIRKKNVVSYDLPLTLNQIADAPTIKFIWKDKEKLGEQVGSIAQYWQKVLPQTIRTEKDDTLSLQYGVAALVSSIITARKVVDHEKRISELEKECADWKQAYSFLERAYNELKLKIA